MSRFNSNPVVKFDSDGEQLRYCIELGADLDGTRVCVVEAGPFLSQVEAVKFAVNAYRRTAKRVLKSAHAYDVAGIHGDVEDISGLRIVGATLNIFTDALGTIEDVDLY